MGFKFIKNQVGNQFFPVKEEEIEKVESTLGLRFPNELRNFLLEVGFGFLRKSECNINRIMGPASIRDARLKINDYEFYPDIEVYEELEHGKLIFLKQMRVHCY